MIYDTPISAWEGVGERKREREGCVMVWYRVIIPLLRTFLRTPLSAFKCGEREPRKRYGTHVDVRAMHAVLVYIRQTTASPESAPSVCCSADRWLRFVHNAVFRD